MKLIINIIINKNYKYYFLILFISLYNISIFINHNNINFNHDSQDLKKEEIYYKGYRILKADLINEYLSKISDEYKKDKEEEREKFINYFYLPDYPKDSFNKSYIRKKLLKIISTDKNQTVREVDTIFLSHNWNFGNSLITVNNAIFLCEVLKCHYIILNKFNLKRRWLITNKIIIDKLNITILQDSNINCTKNNILCIYEISWDTFFPKMIKTQIRIGFIKNEIIKNLPQIQIDKNGLYIHIRGGDIFDKNPLKYYSQPPLCFYEKIINKYIFKNIYIVSMDSANVVIKKLILNNKNIIHIINNFEYDISLLSHAYYIVLSVSSFAISSIKLNDNLKEIWEYDIMRLSEKLFFLHHHLFKFDIKYKIHTMKPSDLYLSKMFSWKNNEEQIKLMLEDNCPYDFVETKKNK